MGATIAAMVWCSTWAQADEGVRIGSVAFEMRTIAVEGSTIAVADVNGDRHLDLVSAGRQLTVQLGDGAGGLQPAARAAPGANPDDLAFADVDADGNVDVIIRSANVMIVLGGAESLQTTTVPAGHDHPWGLAAGDLNGDGVNDLIIVGEGARQGRLYLSARLP